MHTPFLCKQIFHISVTDIGYGMVECRVIQTGSRDQLRFCRQLSEITQRHTHAHKHNVEGLLFRLQGLVLFPYAEPDETNRSFRFLYL